MKIAEFKSKLSEYLRQVRQGQEIIVKDRETPIARLLPYSAPRKRLLTIRPARSLRDIDRLPFFKPKKIKRKDLEEALKWVRRDRF
ncbi:MAG TPA: type II toxin-antitoxin system prevent-host-death family antitoxin [Acidobacteriota bacterium]